MLFKGHAKDAENVGQKASPMFLLADGRDLQASRPTERMPFSANFFAIFPAKGLGQRLVFIENPS